MFHFRKAFVLTALFLVCMTPLWGQQVYAQLEENERNALQDVDAHPMHVGGFEVRPKLTLEEQFADNVFAQDGGEQSDFITFIRPELNIRKKYRDHEFNFDALAGIFRYIDHDTEDIENYGFGFSGHLTALSSLMVPFSASYAVDHKLRNQERTLVSSQEPIKFASYKGEVGLEYKPNRVYIMTYGRYEQRRFDNGVTPLGIAVIREDGDFDSYEWETRIGYETPTKWSPFLSFTYGHSDYVRNTFSGTGFNGPSRDNSYITALAGIGFDYKGLVTGDFAVGYTDQSYDDNTVDDISAIALQSKISWQVRERTRLELQLLRQADEDNEINNGIVETEAALQLQHELDRDLFLNALAEIEHSDFDGSTRVDTIYTGKLGVYYILNPRLQFEAGYTFRNRSSNNPGSDYLQNLFLIGITGRL